MRKAALWREGDTQGRGRRGEKRAGVLPYVVARHGSAADAPIGQNDPAKHALHSVLPSSSWNVPPVHCEH